MYRTGARARATASSTDYDAYRARVRRILGETDRCNGDTTKGPVADGQWQPQ